MTVFVDWGTTKMSAWRVDASGEMIVSAPRRVKQLYRDVQIVAPPQK